MVILTNELISRMLTIWQRRLRDDPATVYGETLLEAALGWPELKRPRKKAPGRQGLYDRPDTRWLGKS
jgi:hypothetical protein